MKKYWLFLFMAIAMPFSKGFATHFAGYDMSLTHIPGGDTYKVKLTIYKDLNGPAPMPVTVNFKTYAQGSNADANVNFTVQRISIGVVNYDVGDCEPPDNLNLVLQVGVFEYTLTAVQALSLNNPAGYYFSSGDCCRNAGIKNVLGNSENYGILFTMDFSRLNVGTNTRYNSSPRFNKNPLAFFCLGKPYTLNWQVNDPDGDSLVFSLAQPLDDAPLIKPFAEIPYAAGYNLNYNILDGAPDLTINPKTGIINFIPSQQGKYLVAFKVEEYRKIAGVPTKIGEIRREYQLEVVNCLEAPPVTEDDNNQKKVIVDTINFPESYEITFTSRDAAFDSLYMFLLPDVSPGENVLDPSTLGGKWGEVGALVGGQDAQNLILEGLAQVKGQFQWTPRCNMIREKPYKFTVVVHDKTCPSPFYDSTFVTLYLRKKENNSPLFANQYLTNPDTIRKTTPENKRLRKYFVRAGDTFQLMGDSIIKTYDKDSSQVVTIALDPDPANGDLNTRIFYNFQPNLIHSTAEFRIKTECIDNRSEPYKFRFYAYDNDCKRPDSVYFDVELYIRDQENKKPIYAHTNPNIVRIPEGKTDSFYVNLYDTVQFNYNKYKSITLMPDFSDFAAVAALGGADLMYTPLTGADSLKVKFTWTPTCANVRLEPYRLFLRVYDEGCPQINNYDTIFVYADGPFNSAPEFRTPDNASITFIDTTIYGGDLFSYSVYAVDTNTRFDSVYLSLDYTTDITNPSVVSNIAYLVPAEGKDSARSNLIWQSTCNDIRPTFYTARVIAKDNECVNPEVNQLVFNITVQERPNRVPTFTFSNATETIDTVYAGETYNFLLAAMDTSDTEFITLDSVYTNVPDYLPKPSITRAQGIGKDTVKTNFTWYADCGLIREEPYLIKVGAWDEACRNPKDSARHLFKIYVLKNPLLQPAFANAEDKTIDLVAGETFTLELNSNSIIHSDSIQILSSGDVYAGIPGNVATFQNTAPGKAQFKWVTTCDQIRDSAYTVSFTTSNPLCKTDEQGFRLKFKVIPNTDVLNPLPNVFSPNSDGKNDVYKIIDQYKVYCDPGFKFTIFNRYGKVLFESKDPAFEWKGDGLGSGTYFYTLESRARSQAGTIDIIK